MRNGAESAATYAHTEGAAPGTWLHAGTPLGHTGHAGLPRLPLLISQPRPSSAADEGLRPNVSLIPLHQACAPEGARGPDASGGQRSTGCLIPGGKRGLYLKQNGYKHKLPFKKKSYLTSLSQRGTAVDD